LGRSSQIDERKNREKRGAGKFLAPGSSLLFITAAFRAAPQLTERLEEARVTEKVTVSYNWFFHI